jgi:hypothetical protein
VSEIPWTPIHDLGNTSQLFEAYKSVASIFMTTLRALTIATLALVAGCGDDDKPIDMSMQPDQAVVLDLSTPPDLSKPKTNTDGGVLNADGGANCGATFDYATRFVAGRTCSTNTGGAAGALCTTSADCAEVCCSCDTNNSNKYMVAMCSDHMCNPDWACLCTDVHDKLMADNVCP